MQGNGSDGLTKGMRFLLDETFEGPGLTDGMFSDPGSGLIGTLESLSAEQASQVVNGTSVASHARHLSLYLSVLTDSMRGIVRMPDWSKEWSETEATAAEWDDIVNRICDSKRGIDALLDGISRWNGDSLTMIGSLAIHTAYHLGAIRQIVKNIEEA